MKRSKSRERKVRSLITGKILNNYEAISIYEIDVYIEKQGETEKYVLKK